MSDKCELCPRLCGARRTLGEKGICGASSTVKIARAALHFWEEPCISGEKGSGAIFFSGCPLHCVFCQNKEISDGKKGREITVERLEEIFFELKEKGANNINLVTPTHFMDSIVSAIKGAKQKGFDLPFVYNTSGYERASELKKLEGLVDVYLPDFKYMSKELAANFSRAADYNEVVKLALEEMVRQVGEADFGEDGIIKKGVIVRHLVLPSHTKDSFEVIKYLYETYGDKIYISLMSQYTPMENSSGTFEKYPELKRKLTKREYERVIDYALSLGVSNAFIQEGEVAKESFIPDFDGEGV